MKTQTLTLLFAILTIGICSAQARVSGVSMLTNVPMAQAINDAQQAADQNAGWMVMLGDGRSMAPYYGKGSVLLVEKTDFSHLKPGMMAVFQDAEGDLVGHWLIRKEGAGWVTQGVNNAALDADLMTQGNYVGVIFGVLKTAGEDATGVAYARQHNLPRVIGKSY